MAKRIGFGLLELVLVAGLIAVLAGGGFYISQLKGRQSAVQEGNNALQQAEDLAQKLNAQDAERAKQLENLGAPAQPVASPAAASSTADWKTYRNEEYGFEFKYPADWQIYSEGARLDRGSVKLMIYNVTFGPPGVDGNPSLPMSVAVYTKSFTEEIMGLSESQGFEKEQTFVNGMGATKLTKGLNTTFFVPHEEFDFVIGGDNKTVDQILSTFKFIK